MSPHNALLLSPARLSPLFVGSSLNLVLFTLELIQAFAYLGSKARRRDSVFIKLGVLLNLVSDLLGTMACCAVTYLYVVKFWGNTDALQKQFWPIVVVDFSVGVSALMAHFFMITRYWQMTKHHTISVFLVLILLAATAGTFGCGVLLALSPDDQSILLDQFSTLALLLHAVGASIIAILLLWQLYKRKDTPVTRWNFFQKTISSLIETGTVAAIVFAAAFGMWYGFRSQTVWIPFTFVVARVYSCTILFVLYTRKESTSNASGNAVEAGAEPARANDAVSVIMFASTQPVTTPGVLDDDDAFRLTEKKMELHNHGIELHYHGPASDSSSDVSRNLNDELREMESNNQSTAPLAISEGSRYSSLSLSPIPSPIPSPRTASPAP